MDLELFNKSEIWTSCLNNSGMRQFRKFITESIADDTITSQLPVLLANLHVLSVKVHNFHWNVKSSDFGPLHKMFDGFYESLNSHIDLVAERLRQFKLVAPGSMREFLALATLTEVQGGFIPAKQMLELLQTDYESLSMLLNDIASKTNDEATKSMIASMIESVDKDAWFITSHLED